MPSNSLALEYAQWEKCLAARVRFGVLFRAGKVEDQVRLDQGSRWDVQHCDFFVSVSGEELELDLGAEPIDKSTSGSRDNRHDLTSSSNP